MQLFLGMLAAGVMTTSVSPTGLGPSDGGVVHEAPLGACDDWVSRVVQDEMPEEAVGLLASEGAPSDGGLVYSADLTDEELARRFREDLPSLGSISRATQRAS